MMDNTYKLKKDILSQTIYIYKIRSGFSISDRIWDKTNWGRAMVSAKKFATIFENNLSEIGKCIKWGVNYLEHKNLSWTLETLLRYVPHYMKQRVVIQHKQMAQVELEIRTKKYEEKFNGTK